MPRSLAALLALPLLACAADPTTPLAPAASPTASLAPGPSPTPAGPLLRAEGGRFLDRNDRVVILRGVNVAGNSKVPPFLPFTDPARLDSLPPMGVNVIRLLLVWEAYQPSPGAYDESYLDSLLSIADAAWARGIMTIVDIHQDGFSRYLAGGCGDGFPSWAVFPGITLATPDNRAGCSNWPARVALDPGSQLSYQGLYANVAGVRDAYLAMLGRVAGRSALHPGVIGYDPLNEPWGDETTELGPLYADAAAALRAADPEAILFLEGEIATNTGLPSLLPRPAFGNVAYAPHFYDPLAIGTGTYLGITTPTDLAFLSMTATAAAWGAPLFLGEFGIGGNASGGPAYIDLQLDRLDANLASGTQWSWTPGWTPTAFDGWNGENTSVVDDQGHPRPTWRVHPYPTATAGTPESFQVAADGSLNLQWTADPAKGATEIFLSAAPSTITASGASCAFDPASQRLVCSATAPGEARLATAP